MSGHAFHGLYPVLYAFHKASGALDNAAMRRQVEHCLGLGAHGLMALGLITEVGKHTTAERHEIVGAVAEALSRRKPFMVTVGEPTTAEQLTFAREARRNGADVIILQPPAQIESEAALLRFFGATADALDCPVAVQHNPFNLAVNLSLEGLVVLHRNHPNITVLKGEGTAVETQQLLERTDGKLANFSGHGGIEFMSNLRAGVAGLIPAPDQLAVQVRIYELFRQGTPAALAEAERLHIEVLPLIVFMIRSVQQALCYGKRFYARQIGVEIAHERPPVQAPTAFGLAEMDRLYARYVATLSDISKRS
ncbi:MAG: dihydrodipicolinate synthase family protein [Hyphomicrobiaceae bacterium]